MDAKDEFIKGKVAPYTGAWIEIIKKGLEKMKNRSRTLHGCVD